MRMGVSAELDKTLGDSAPFPWASEGSDASGSWSDDAPDDDPITVRAACSLLAMSSGNTCIPQTDLPSKFHGLKQVNSFTYLSDLSTSHHNSRPAPSWNMIVT